MMSGFGVNPVFFNKKIKIGLSEHSLTPTAYGENLLKKIKLVTISVAQKLLFPSLLVIPKKLIIKKSQMSKKVNAKL